MQMAHRIRFLQSAQATVVSGGLSTLTRNSEKMICIASQTVL